MFRYFFLQISVIANITTFPFSRKFHENRPAVTVFSTPGCFLLEVRVKLGVVADVLICILYFSQKKKSGFSGKYPLQKYRMQKLKWFFHFCKIRNFLNNSSEFTKIRETFLRKFPLSQKTSQHFRYLENFRERKSFYCNGFLKKLRGNITFYTSR